MYCVNCGVRLGDAEARCPLCGTAVYHPDLTRPAGKPMYPVDKKPHAKPPSKGIHGLIIFLFFFPLYICFVTDYRTNGALNWFGYVAGAAVVTYVTVALPLWFRKPNPVIFVPCSFASVAAYLWYICFHLQGDWFWGFALPLVAGLCLIVTTVVTLFRYLRRGRLYVLGGAAIALGGLMLLAEDLMTRTFSGTFNGWSLYPLLGLALLGGMLIYVAGNRAARETLQRKLFF